jgi:hypothetical protein
MREAMTDPTKPAPPDALELLEDMHYWCETCYGRSHGGCGGTIHQPIRSVRTHILAMRERIEELERDAD